MKSPLHILHLEDNPVDAEMILSTLEVEGIRCEIVCVQTREGLVAALEHGGIDLILSDFSMPGYDGMSALKLVHARWPAIPVIFVSGTLGEEVAIDSLKNGATDYVLKERMPRLAPAVRRAMQEVEDRAERRRLEALFIEAQKMEVIGQLAGGVAHDFNNILGVIMGYSDLTILKLGNDSVLKSNVETIRMAAERAAGLTRQLLVFSRRQTVQLIVLDLNDVIHDLDKMLRRLIDEHVEMSLVLGKEIGHVKADSGYVGQVLMNLVVNARDAMPRGGKLVITTSNATLVETSLHDHASVVPGNYVMLSVSDTGSGMTDEVKAHLFEAFFTTKPKGKGTGLGLATCHTIVQQFKGYIEVDSGVGKGATFKVYLPEVKLPLAETKPRESVPLPRGSETLLLVEDEPSVRHLACDVLENQGYRVLRAANGQEGLQVARGFKDHPISLVITDVIMPLMGGTVMADWLKTANPDIKILFTSGYADDALTHQGALSKGVEFLPKPYTPSTLALKVRRMLDSK